MKTISFHEKCLSRGNNKMKKICSEYNSVLGLFRIWGFHRKVPHNINFLTVNWCFPNNKLVQHLKFLTCQGKCNKILEHCIRTEHQNPKIKIMKITNIIVDQTRIIIFYLFQLSLLAKYMCMCYMTMFLFWNHLYRDLARTHNFCQ